MNRQDEKIGLAHLGRPRRRATLVCWLVGILVAMVACFSDSLLQRAMVMGTHNKPSNTWERLKPMTKEKRAQPLNQKQLEVKAYESSLEECAAEGDYTRAMGLIDDMRERGIWRTLPIWHGVLKACAEAGKAQEAANLITEMNEEGKVAPDHIALHAMLDALIRGCENGDAYCNGDEGMAKMQHVFSEMPLRGMLPNVLTYMKGVTYLAKAHRDEEALEMYQLASKEGHFELFTNRGRFLDLQDVPLEVAMIAVRDAVEKRSSMMATTGKAGREGFYVLTGQATKKAAYKQQAVMSVLQEEFGLKLRLDPIKFGRLLVRGEELKRVGMERELEMGRNPPPRPTGRDPARGWQRHRKKNHVKETADGAKPKFEARRVRYSPFKR
eukprot:TRINITY_DN104240_c0_g1_i1.p1 TRINITY_DN104240_c0_g1~~TRINITY_DN104240_c0_g1_i1.p1  ORF type:complete len:383 (-),score=98.89 TRINITY_DN104240_c0_g1_i1:186-1334(-)